jgi:hypothetical protein
MGFFSRFFKPPPKEISFVRKWAIERKQKAGSKDIFAVMVYGISVFRVAENTIRDKKAKSYDYSGDASLFEIACFSYSWFNLLLSKRGYDFLSSLFFRSFISLFLEAFRVDRKYVQDLFSERTSKYSELLKDENLEKMRIYLVELLLRTKDNTSPRKANFENFRLI